MKSFIIILTLLASLAYLGTCQDQESPHPLWPMPVKYQSGQQNITISSPCNFNFAVTSGNEIPQMDELFQQYRELIFPQSACATVSQSSAEDTIEIVNSATPDSNVNGNSQLDSTLYIHVSDTSKIYMNLGVDESYYLQISPSGGFNLSATTYLGFVRGLETFSQLVTLQTDSSGSNIWIIPFAPIIISDYPRYPHRGFMLDTSRHFMPKEDILTILDGLMYSKLNVFHWHLTDSDSFPIYLPSHPNLTIFGAFEAAEVYSQTDVQEIVAYATTRAIRIIPEIDSPAHSRSWWLSPEFSNLFTCTGDDFWIGTPLGQIDPTMPETYQALADIFGDIQNYFPGQYIHMGADEVFGECWGERTSITNWMDSNNVSDYNGLFNYYIKTSRATLESNRTAVYWTNPDTDYLVFNQSDVLQYWGNTTTLPFIMELYPNNSFILSNFDTFYLDCGMGNYFGNVSWCNFTTWKDIYEFEPTEILTEDQLEQVIGVETCQWGELMNPASIDKTFPRASALAERVWSSLNNPYNNTLSVVERLNEFHWRLLDRGVPSGPITSEFCERNPKLCFGTNTTMNATQ